MKRYEYLRFEEEYLGRFKKYYKECTNNSQRKELRASIFNNNNLTAQQKEKFWEKVTK